MQKGSSIKQLVTGTTTGRVVGSCGLQGRSELRCRTWFQGLGEAVRFGHL